MQSNLNPWQSTSSHSEVGKSSWIRGWCNTQTHFLFSSHTLILKIIPDSTRHQRQPAETEEVTVQTGGAEQGKSLKNKPQGQMGQSCHPRDQCLQKCMELTHKPHADFPNSHGDGFSFVAKTMLDLRTKIK